VPTTSSGFAPLPGPNPPVDCTLPMAGHPGSIQVGMCDGRVAQVSPLVSPLVWFQYSTPNGREVPDPSWP